MGKKTKKNKQNPSRNRNSNNNNSNNNNKNNNGNKKTGRWKKNNRKKYRKGSEEDIRLRESIEGDGSKTIIDMEADGNCLFRSISDQLFHDHGQNHAEIRSDICDYLEAFEQDFKLFLVLDDEDANDEEDAADFETYIENMRQDGDWGGNLELVAAAKLYRRDIMVFSTSLAAFTIEHGSVDGKKASGPVLLLSYHDNHHYNSVRDNAAKGKPPPCIKTFEKKRTLSNNGLSHGCSGVETNVGMADDEQNDVEASARHLRPADSVECTSESRKEAQTTNTSGGRTLAHKKGEASDGPGDDEERRKRPTPKKKAPCPCGSGLKYKKCCGSQRKQKQQLSGTDDGGTSQTKLTEMMNGDFQVLKI